MPIFFPSPPVFSGGAQPYSPRKELVPASGGGGISGLSILNFNFPDKIFQNRDFSSGIPGWPDGTQGKLITFMATYTGGPPVGTAALKILNKTGGGVIVGSTTAFSNYSASGGIVSGKWFVPFSAISVPWVYAEMTLDGFVSTQTLYHSVGRRKLEIGHSHRSIIYTDGTPTGTIVPNARRVNGGGFIDIGLALQAGEVAPSNGCEGETYRVVTYHANCPANLTTCWVQQGYPSTVIGDWEFTSGSAWVAMAAFLSVAEIDDCETVCFYMGVNNYPGPAYTFVDIVNVFNNCLTLFNRTNSTMKFSVTVPGQRGAGSDSNANIIRQAHFDFVTIGTTTGRYLSHCQEDIRIFGSVGHFVAPVGTMQDAGREAYFHLAIDGYKPAVTLAPNITGGWCVPGSNVITLITDESLVLGTGASSGTARLQLGKLNTTGIETLTALNLVSGQLQAVMSSNRGAGEAITFEFAPGIGPYDPIGLNFNQDTSLYDTRSDLTFDQNNIGRPLLPTALHPITISETPPASPQTSSGSACIPKANVILL